ncbi:alpha/beta fold hydrolase [Mycolicibacterium litorale]|uniref:Alpha/beta hydrolase n=1 Tax=Mycolicibacterium litorale TaxID=758802 RepID=A0AAD1ILC2_9MYCO|nr:alpha/beta hydrolase [Mycolicibacterium litorale]MCV7416238.1 alpha/beta hydrolase [Mycolicibacterium litorale]TDY09489.1 pimeloyl-ACP methyl ester carboxylesterase [Mycolicibacterium litorale]BBY17435.1 alpha/beta hydrolase [Mycolicibacterium litorale]
MTDNEIGRRGHAGWLAGVAGLAAVGSLAGVTVARSLTRRVTDDDPYAGEDFELLDADRSSVVTTTDGVPLAVREVGPTDAPVTVVFAHGFCLRMGAFHFQRARLSEQWGDQVRMVFYDQRGHGQSGAAPPDTYTVTQLGQDLEAVLAVVAPRGPVVLVGHSMGGMTVLSHARQYPQSYPTRVVGAAIISSAAEGVARSPLGEILKNPALEAVRFTARYAPGAVHRTRGLARAVIAPILRAASYGDEKISPSVVAFSEKMMHGTPIVTLVEFLHALEVHDEAAALPTLAKIPTLIACGDRDLLTPVESSREMAAALPKSELVVVPGAGHLVQLEQPEVIDDALVRLVERATPSKLVALTRRLRERVRPRG